MSLALRVKEAGNEREHEASRIDDYEQLKSAITRYISIDEIATMITVIPSSL